MRFLTHNWKCLTYWTQILEYYFFCGLVDMKLVKFLNAINPVISFEYMDHSLIWDINLEDLVYKRKGIYHVTLSIV